MLETVSSQSTEEAYIKWLNDHLAKATPPLIVSDLNEENICNGVAIGVLLEIIGGIKIDGLLLQPITIVERLHNIHEVFSVLRRLNVKLNNIQPEDIMEGDKDTVLELLIAINDYFTPKAVNKSTKKLFTNNNHTHDNDYKLDSNGRTSAWSNLSSSTRRTPISRPDTATITSLNGNHDNGLLPLHHHSQKNLLHSTNGIDYPPTIDLPWSNSSDQLTDTRQAYSYHHSLAPTPTPSELTNSTSPRSKCNVYRVRSDPLSPRSSHGKRETSSSTTPINIRSALPNLNSGSRGYYNHHINPSQGSTKNHDRNGYAMRNGRPTSELPHLYDSMNEIQQLKSQLNSLSKLIESDGSNPIRTAAALGSTVTKSTQTEFGYLLDRQAKKSNAEISELRGIIKIKEEAIHLLEEENSRLSDSLKTILYNMNKPNNLDKTTMSGNYSIRHQDYPDFFDSNKSTSLNNSVVKPHHHHHHNQQQQQQQQRQQQNSVQQQQNYRNQPLPRHHHNDPNHLQQQKRTHTPTNSTTNLNTPMIISPSQLSTMKSHAYDQQPTLSSSLPRSISPCKSDNSERQISPVRQPSPERLKEIRRQLSPTGKRFPYYQPYIHLLLHSNELNKVDKHKCSAEPKTRGLTTAQSQIVKSPTQRLLMQSLPTTSY